MHRADIWVADDGKVFDGENAYRDCRAYENEQKEKSYQPLYDLIRFFNWKGEMMSFHRVREGDTVYYAQVLRIPEEDDDYRYLWNQIVPEELSDQLWYETDCGIWVNEDEQNWHSWESIVKDFEEIKTCVNKIKGEG